MMLDLNKLDNFLEQKLSTYDPYDLWKTKFGLWMKKIYYEKGKITIPLLSPFYIMDIYCPKILRIFIKPQEYPIVRALAVLSALNLYEITFDRKYINLASSSVEWLINNQSPGYNGACWGINFPWMTKEGYCQSSTPFITHTPYCVEALLKYYDHTKDIKSLKVALSSLDFLENDIKVLFDRPDMLALSYGPSYENRIVINANSYAMMMYALLAKRYYEKSGYLLEKAIRLFNYIKSRQNEDGSWFYFADKNKGNFIDCFHSCFILKNLNKFSKYSNLNISFIINKGLNYILRNLLDEKYLLTRKFTITANPSLVKFDLYDQAELLNLLLMNGHFDLAQKLYNSIMKYFYIPTKGTFGYQIDIFGKLNKMIYLRWAIMPMVYTLTNYYKIERKNI